MPLILKQWAADILYSVPNVLAALAIFLAGLYLARLAAGALTRLLHSRRIASSIAGLLAHTVYWTIVMVGLVMALQRFFDVTAFLAGLGLLGFTVGFALQDVMKNFAAGIILLLQQPFRVGEAISVAGFDGTILAIDLRATEMSTFDGRIVSIPNGTVLTNPITNYSRALRRRVEIPLQVSPRADLERTRHIVLDAIQHTPGVVADPAPSVILEQLGDSSLNLTGSFWVDVSKQNPDLARDKALSRIEVDLHRSNGGATSPSDDPTPTNGGSQSGAR